MAADSGGEAAEAPNLSDESASKRECVLQVTRARTEDSGAICKKQSVMPKERGQKLTCPVPGCAVSHSNDLLQHPGKEQAVG